MAFDQGRLECLHNQIRLTLAGADFRHLDHPLAIAIAEVICLGVVGSSFFKAQQPLFQTGAANQEVGSVRTDLDRLRVALNGPGIVFEIGLQSCQHQGPAHILG